MRNRRFREVQIYQALASWADAIFLDLKRQLRWSFLPPLMVYFAAGVSGLTAIVGTFFVKEYLGLSAAFLAGLSFWAGLPWALKMPVGHLVDVIWRWKSVLVFAGAGLIASSLLIMYFLISATETMTAIMPMGSWYVLAVLLSPCGYLLQDTVADAMSVEAVPKIDEHGNALSEQDLKSQHTTMQTLGRIALISGLVFVAALNIYMFSGIEALSIQQKAETYARIYLYALAIPIVSVSGVLLAAIMKSYRWRELKKRNMTDQQISAMIDYRSEETEPNYWYFFGGAAFVAVSISLGLSDFSYSQEAIFIGSMIIIVMMMWHLAKNLSRENAMALFGTAIIVFIFRATPLPGPGAVWFEIDVLGFDQQFLSVLTFITSILTLVGMFVLRPMMATRTISDIMILLTIAAGILSLPNISLYYGIQNWTAPLTNGVVDARFIAVLDTMVESPLGQIAMIPMLAWIANNAPENLKATFFAVMASFTNLALSASALLTKYMNQIFTVTREVKDQATGVVQVAADYSQLGWLLVSVALIGLAAPLITIFLVHRSPLRPTQ